MLPLELAHTNDIGGIGLVGLCRVVEGVCWPSFRRAVIVEIEVERKADRYRAIIALRAWD
jgi:hypothetical protein